MVREDARHNDNYRPVGLQNDNGRAQSLRLAYCFRVWRTLPVTMT